MPKFASTAKESLTLSAVGSSFATLAKFDPAGDKQAGSSKHLDKDWESEMNNHKSRL
jgi:hypothetical protein